MLLENIFQGEFYAKFLQNPAGTKLHHAYLGGLFQHGVDVTKLAVAMGEQIDGVNLDLIIAGSLLHDIGKVQEISADFGFPYTTSGRFVGHIALTVLIVQKKAEELMTVSIQRLIIKKNLLQKYKKKMIGYQIKYEFPLFVQEK